MSQRVKTNYSYKGWNITLVMTLEGYMWTCQYIIRRSGRTVMDGFQEARISRAKRKKRLWVPPRSDRSVSAGQESARYLARS